MNIITISKIIVVIKVIISNPSRIKRIDIDLILNLHVMDFCILVIITTR